MQNKRRTQAQWLAVFDKQQSSGLSIKAFCQHHDIHLQTFYARKSDLRPRAKPGRALVKIEKPISKVPSASITCQFKGVEMSCNDAVNPQWFADMVKALAQ